MGNKMRSGMTGPAAIVMAIFAIPAQAGCGIEVTVKNELNRSIVLDREQTKVRVMGPGTNPVPSGPWRRFFDENITLPANSTRVRRTDLAQGCSAGPREFKFFFAAGPEIKRVNRFVIIPVDQKFRVRIRD
jgi:hypothetical protein